MKHPTFLLFLVVLASCQVPTATTPALSPVISEAGAYTSYAELTVALQHLRDEYPSLCRVSSIGRSVEGRDLWALKVTNEPDGTNNRPKVVFFGGHHAREWISVDVPLRIAQRLCADTDTAVQSLLSTTEVWFVPMVNPDGHQYSIDHDRLWRKNRRVNLDKDGKPDGTFGVDLNRNYGYQWGLDAGSSSDPAQDTYRGPTAFSEPETQAVRDFLDSLKPKVVISYHNYSQLILYPWGYTSDASTAADKLKAMANTMATKILAVHGVTYTPEQSSSLYTTSGDLIDWTYGTLGTLAFTIELRPENWDSVTQGFELPENQIVPTVEENYPAALYAIGQAGPMVPLLF